MCSSIKETWKESLKQKFKDYRRPLTSDADVVALKLKYGRKTRKNLLEQDFDEVPRHKRANIVRRPSSVLIKCYCNILSCIVC